MAKHHPASTVISPQDCINGVSPIYDGGPTKGEYAVAIVDWQGQPCIGIRWNITERELNNPDKLSGKTTCVGEPNSRGYATWFILPDDFLSDLLSNSNIAKKIREYMGESE